MKTIKGWIVIQEQNKGKIIPLDQRFFVNKPCAECLRNEMNFKKSLEPETHFYSYKIVPSALMIKE